MRGRVNAIRTFKGLVADLRFYTQRSRDFAAANLQGEALRQWKYQTYLRDYMAVIHSVDESVGELLNYLDRNGLLDNTIVVYTSDQGFYMGEHGWFDKRFMYEESFRTPLVVRYPKEIKPGNVSHQLVQNIDYVPTFLDYAGVKKPKEMPGRSLKPLFRADSTRWRHDLYYHYYDYPAWHMVRKHAVCAPNATNWCTSTEKEVSGQCRKQIPAHTGHTRIQRIHGHVAQWIHQQRPRHQLR